MLQIRPWHTAAPKHSRLAMLHLRIVIGCGAVALRRGLLSLFRHRAGHNCELLKWRMVIKDIIIIIIMSAPRGAVTWV